jgi:hypothetical protein
MAFHYQISPTSRWWPTTPSHEGGWPSASYRAIHVLVKYWWHVKQRVNHDSSSRGVLATRRH